METKLKALEKRLEAMKDDGVDQEKSPFYQALKKRLEEMKDNVIIK